MKKILIFLLAVCVITGLVPFGAQSAKAMADYSSTYVFDDVGILDSGQIQDLDNKAAEISDKYSSGTYIIIVDDYSTWGSSPKDAAENLYTQMGFGYGNDSNGELLLLSMSERDYWLAVKGYAANEAFGEYARSVVEDAFLDDFHDDDWYDGFSDYLSKSSELLDRAAKGDPLTGSPMQTALKWGISLLVGLIIAFIVGAVLKGQMKSVAQKVEARSYVKDGSFVVSYRNDYFKYSTETRRKIEKSSSSGSKGGFSGSGGKF